MHKAIRQLEVRNKARKLVKQSWESQANLSFFLALLILVVFVLPLTRVVEQHLSIYVDIAYSLLAISGMAIAWPRKLLFFLGLTVGIVSLLTRFGSWQSVFMAKLREPSMLLAILVMIVVLFVEIFRTGAVTGTRIQGAVAAYLLIGLAWAHAYAIVNRHYPNAFASSTVPLSTVSSWIYFSFMTLTTVGYGDVVPTLGVARMLAVGEALTGQIYLTVLIARLVALQVSGSAPPHGPE